MKFRSFRVRIALLSAILAGGALTGFGIVSWWLIYEAKVSRLDAKLESLLSRPRPLFKDIGQFNENLLAVELGTDAQTPIAILIIGSDRQIIYKSEGWSGDFKLDGVWPPRPQQFPFSLPPPSTAERPRPQFDSKPPPPPLRPRLVTQYTKTGTWRIGAIAFPQSQVAIAVSLEGLDREMSVIRDVFLIAIPVVLLLIAGGAWLLSGSALRPISQLVIAIRQVTVTGLDQRVPISGMDTEFLELIQVFNKMLERLERSFKQASRFSGDAAHELKTPLAILQGELERTLQQAELGSELQQELSNLLDEVRRLSGIVRKLLLLSLADAGQMSLYRVEVDLSEVLSEIVEDLELLAPDLKIQIKIADGLKVQGDRDLLIQVLQNLFSNAIKYNLPNGWLEIHARHQHKTVLVTISNSSKDILASDRKHIFDRFHRGDLARTRKIEGTGLGLSLAKEITLAHGGTLNLDQTPSGQTSFTLSLPISS